MSPSEEKGEISNEFFKRLNQQIVQKDNLIKLLQLQIKNLKTQVEEGGSESGKKGDLQKALETKEGEIGNLLGELDALKAKMASLEQEKFEQIQALNKIIQEGKSSGIPGEESRVNELESTVARLEQEYQAEKAGRIEAQEALEAFQKSHAASAGGSSGEIAKLEKELGKRDQAVAGLEQEIAELRSKIEQADQDILARNNELADLRGKLESGGGGGTVDAGRLAELEQDVQTLKGLLAEKDEQLANAGLQPAQDPRLLAELEDLKKQSQRVSELEKLVVALESEVTTVPALKAKLSSLESESTAMAEAAMKMTALESEREQLLARLKDLEAKARQTDEFAHRLEQKENELASLRVAAESRGDQGMDEGSARAEVEQLTSQVADQLLAIQKFEELLRRSQEQLTRKDEELAMLRNKLASAGEASRPIPISSDGEIISSFIDFFDGLDTYLAKNPIPELQSLHRKLLDRLIIPNEIHYMPVISEEFDEGHHIATDYFRSIKFPEKCIVFELEKGYRKGDIVIKKSKVWVVQNLFTCRSCQTLQSNPDSRFCHMCGQRIVAPNNLPIESLPWFEPTPTTYLRFAERMMEKGRLPEAKTYLGEGLKLDQEFVPLMVRLAEVHSLASEFPEAIGLLQKAVSLKPDSRLADQIKGLEVKNTIYQQARALNLPPDEFEKLINLIQTKNPSA